MTTARTGARRARETEGALKTVSILGAGQLGRAVAEILAAGGSEVRMWSRRSTSRRAVGKRFPQLVLADSVAAACEAADLVIFAVPASALREVARAYGETATGDQIVLHATHGVGEGFVLPHQVLREETCVRKIGALGGPLQAREIAAGRPLAAVLASRFDETWQVVQALVAGLRVRIYPSRDVVGVEVAGAISNVTALAVGMADQLELGDTARGVLLTRGLVEAGRLGQALGADPSTFAGLAGVGDLIPRRITTTQRAHAVGGALAQGQALDEILAATKGEVEGVATAAEAVRLAERLGLELPLIQAVDMVLHGEADARQALEDVLQLDLDLSRGLVPAGR